MALTLTITPTVPPARHPPRADITSRSQHSRCAEEEAGRTVRTPAPPWASTSPPEKWVRRLQQARAPPSSPLVPGLELRQQGRPPPLGLDDGAGRQVRGVVTGVVLVLEQPHVLQQEDRGSERPAPHSRPALGPGAAGHSWGRSPRRRGTSSQLGLWAGAATLPALQTDNRACMLAGGWGGVAWGFPWAVSEHGARGPREAGREGLSVRLTDQAPNCRENSHTCVMYVSKDPSQKKVAFRQNPPTSVTRLSRSIIIQEKRGINRSDAADG